MVFKSDEQRRAVFARLNRFSVANMPILTGGVRTGVSMLAKTINRDKVEEMDRDPNWVACDKYDGIRAMAVGQSDKIELFNPRKGGDDFSSKFPEVMSDMSSAFKGYEPYIIEGELTSAVHDKRDFHNVVARLNMTDGAGLSSHISEHPVVFRVFDILEIGGNDVKDLPLRERREILNSIIDVGSNNLKLEDCVYDNKLAYADSYIASGGEGVMFKNLNSKYESGRSGNWVKYKKPEGGTYIVYGFERGKGSNENGVGSLLIGEFKDGEFISRGKVGSGLTVQERHILYDKYGLDGMDVRTLPETEWFGVDLKYMEVDTRGALRQPRVERLREDLGIEAFMEAS
jgi:ATP-dependent DNA ligase